jgi:hypothetical protein
LNVRGGAVADVEQQAALGFGLQEVGKGTGKFVRRVQFGITSGSGRPKIGWSSQ